MGQARHRRTLTEKGFEDLVRGKVLSFTLGPEVTFELCLSDIGWVQMVQILREAQADAWESLGEGE